MVLLLLGLFVIGAAAYHWHRTRSHSTWIDPRQQYLATLLLVSTTAYDDRNNELYQASLKEIVGMMSKECWERPEIEWRMRQALLIARDDTTPEHFQKVHGVSENIARWTVYSPKQLPWESRSYIRLLAQSSRTQTLKAS